MFNSSGLIISIISDNEATPTTYTTAGSTIETVTTLGTYAAPTATKCRFREVSATNHKGLYEFQFADARYAVANARRLVVSVTGATNLLDADYEVQLVQFDPYDAVRLGLTVFPNVAQGNSGQLPTADATGKTLLQATQTGVTIPTVTTLTNAPSNSAGVTTILARIIGTLGTGTHQANGSNLTALGDTRLANLDATVASRAATGAAMTLTTGERDAIATALLDLAGTIDGETLRRAIAIIAGMTGGIASGAGTGTETFKGLNKTTTRAVITASTPGNRTDVSYP